MPNPSASATDAAHAIAEDAAQDSTAGLPSAASDLAGLDGSIASEAHPAEPELDEEDWQFTEEVRVEGDDDLDSDEDFGVETDFGETFDDATLSGDTGGKAADVTVSGLELERAGTSDPPGEDIAIDRNADSATALGLDSEIGDVETVEAGHDVSSFGAVEDFSALAEDIDTGGIDTGPGEIPDLSDASKSGLYSASGPTDDLGDPESWDLAPGADYDASKASIAGLVGSFSSGGAEAAGLSGSGPLDVALDPAQFDADLDESSTLFARLASLGSWAGWLLTVTAVGVVGYLSLDSEWARWESTLQQLSQGPFVAETTDVRWVETTRLGSLLVVDGVARNVGAEMLAPPWLQVELLDAEGKRLPGGGIAVGVPMLERILREATPAEMEQARLDAPRRFRTTALRPGESRAFQVVLAELPDGARRLLLDVGEAVVEPPPEPEPRRAIEAEAGSTEAVADPSSSSGASPPSVVETTNAALGTAGALPAQAPILPD